MIALGISTPLFARPGESRLFESHIENALQISKKSQTRETCTSSVRLRAVFARPSSPRNPPAHAPLGPFGVACSYMLSCATDRVGVVGTATLPSS